MSHTFHIVKMLDKIRQSYSHSLWNIAKKCGEAPPPPQKKKKNKLMRGSCFFMFRRLQTNVISFIYKQHFCTYG